MTPATSTHEVAPLPVVGTRVLMDGLPGGPWSSVIERLEDGVMVLDPPRLGGKIVAMPMKRRFIVAYSLREIPCEVDAVMVGGPAKDGSGGYQAEIQGAARRMQRRGAVRVPVHLLAHVGLEGAKDPDAESIGAVTEDLSAGGVLLRTVEPIDAGTHITTTVSCGGDLGSLEVKGRVVRCDRTDSEDRPFRVAVAFVDLPRPDEDRLIRYLFEKQREMRRRDAGLA